VNWTGKPSKSLVAAAALILVAAASWSSLAISKDANYQAYRKDVVKESNKNYRANKDTIDPGRERGKAAGKDLDHIKSVKDCYKDGTSASACASPNNLRILDASQNRSEGCRTPGCRK